MENEIVKCKSQRHRRVLQNRESKIFENDKTAIFIRGGNTSDVVSSVLQEFHRMKKPGSIHFRKRNISRPFEDQTSIEFLTKMNDASLFLFGSHSKKRPHNLVIGRTFDHQILDMVELGIENFQSFTQIKGGKFSVGTKPSLVFSGNDFETDEELRRLKSLFIDFFRGPVVNNVTLKGLEHVMSFTANEGTIYIRNYKVQLKKSGTRTPRIELLEMGPNLDLVVRRTKLASVGLYKASCKKPRAAKPSKTKNISRDEMGARRGRIHMTKQDIGAIRLRKVKALKRKLNENVTDEKKEKIAKSKE